MRVYSPVGDQRADQDLDRGDGVVRSPSPPRAPRPRLQARAWRSVLIP